MSLSVRDVVAAMEALYPPAVAEGWDSVGLIAGDPAAPVSRVLLAVDPVESVVDEAIEAGAQMVITHHPLFLRGVNSVAADTFKGRVIHRLVSAGIALYNAHTNADSAERGVADALADACGLLDRRPLVPRKEVEPVPESVEGVETSASPPSVGLGRVGRLPEPTTLGALAQRVADVLPRVAQGVRVAGPLDAPVATVAVLGGSGDSLFDAVRASGVDVYVTSDLRHHPASEAREAAAFGDGRPYLIDTAHFASEWPWLRYAAHDLAERLDDGVECVVSERVSDPWTATLHPLI